MHAAEGILTSPGGMTSHAAVVARGMGKPCVAGAGDVRIDAKAGTLVVRGTTVKTGEIITLDGSTGEIILGVVPTVQPEMSGDFAELMAWADEVRTLGSAPTPRRRRMPPRRASSAPRASASAAPSTCSSTPTASSPCAR